MPTLTEKEAQDALSAKLKEKIASMSDEEVAAELARHERLERLEKTAADEQVGGAFMFLGRQQAWGIFTEKVAAAGGLEKMSDEQKAEALAETEAAVDELGADIAEREGELIEAREAEAAEGALPEKDAQDLAALRAFEKLHPGELAKVAREKLASEGYEIVEKKGEAKK